jgi:hypothetical protein
MIWTSVGFVCAQTPSALPPANVRADASVVKTASLGLYRRPPIDADETPDPAKSVWSRRCFRSSGERPALGKTLIDYFQPTPIVCPLTSQTWGAAGVVPATSATDWKTRPTPRGSTGTERSFTRTASTASTRAAGSKTRDSNERHSPRVPQEREHPLRRARDGCEGDGALDAGRNRELGRLGVRDGGPVHHRARRRDLADLPGWPGVARVPLRQQPRPDDLVEDRAAAAADERPPPRQRQEEPPREKAPPT